MQLVWWIIIKQQKVDNDDAINQLTKIGPEGRVCTLIILDFKTNSPILYGQKRNL